MWPASLARLLRRRMLYILLALFTLIYLLLQILNKHGAWSALQYEESEVQRTRPLIWRTLQGDDQQPAAPADAEDTARNHTSVVESNCRNSLQGSELLVDELGYVCAREALLPSGCCDVAASQTTSYNCQSCNATTHCCGVYEYCVSCCLQPDKKPLLELVLSQVRGRQAIVFAAVADQYELCLVKCRTSSHSVAHENRYRDEQFKHCYGHTTAHESELEVLGGVLPAD